MKDRHYVKIIIPIAFLIGIIGASVAAILSGQLAIASTNESVALTDSPKSMNLWVGGDPPEISGESKRANRVGSIDVIAYSLNLKIDWDTGTARSAGNAEFSPLRIVKGVDKATPKLYEYCVQGKIISGKVILRCYYESTELPKQFLAIEIESAVVISIQSYGTTEPGVFTEIVSFGYTKIKMIYTEYDEQGNSKGNVEFQWNLETNTAS